MTRKEGMMMTNMTWTLDAEGRLKVAWITPPAAKTAAPPAQPLHAAYRRIQTSLTRRRVG